MIRGLTIPLALLLGRLAAAPLDCAPCHRPIADSFARTAHARASSPANEQNVQGPFDAEMLTSVKGVYFRLERRGDGRLYQTGIQPGGRSQTERFDLVIGSGRRGQSYLYWRDGLLFQLPVSYHVASRQWINSPGYEDGVVNFGRGIPPQCLACHASGFRLEPASARGGLPRYAPGYALGIQCTNCHGEAERHDQLRRPSAIDLCARCHAGLAEEPHPVPDVHGNQVGLLKSSRCFQQSGGGMTCGTCHDVHRLERDPVVLSARCGMCHQPTACTARGNRSNCVECHMPLTPSKLIQVQSYRTHRIGKYRR